MQLFWLGHSCFKLQSKEAVLITDPYAPSLGLGSCRSKADIITLSHHHADHDYTSGILGDPFIIDCPGEYEVKKIFIKGIASYHDAEEGKKLGGNTIYLFDVENVRLCHLGDLGHSLSNGLAESLGEVDVLMIPVGGPEKKNYTIDFEKAVGIISQLEPNIVIPMHFAVNRLKFKPPLDKVDKFLKEMGVGGKEKVDKLILKKKDLEGEAETRVVLFQ